MKVTKRVTFESSHHLDNPDLPFREAKEIFGKCFGYHSRSGRVKGKEIFHGHSYKCEVTVEGERSWNTGFLINFKNLKEIVNKHIVDLFDHNCLNDVMPKKYWPTTVENMLLFIIEKTDIIDDISFASGGGNLQSIKIWETEDSFAEWNPPEQCGCVV